MAKTASVKKVCAFCNDPNNSRRNNLIEGVIPNVYICAECVQKCTDMFLNEQKSRLVNDKLEIPSPRQLLEHLDNFIIGQTYAKKVLSVAAASHFKRLEDKRMTRVGEKADIDPQLQDVVLEKSNILLVGPTGSGKTLLAKSLAKELGVPLAIGDATTLTEAGYVGEDVENLLLKLLMQADFDLEVAQKGIIFIDEIDKIGKSHGNVSITRDVSGEGVQQALLKIIEGTVANVPPGGGRKHPEQQYIQFDTSDVLFICGGSFDGLTDIIKKRIGGGAIGFKADAKKNEDCNNVLLNQVEPEDLEQFGLIPEFVGRLPIIAPLQELTEEDMVRILTEPKNAILRQYQKRLALDGASLNFTPAAIREIAKIAKSKKTGARALRSVVESFMLDFMFEDFKGKEINVDIEMVRKQQKKLPEAA